MAVPLDAIRAFHNAFRKDMKAIDEAALQAARGGTGMETVAKRYNLFNEILVWHADGEEEYVFTAMEKVAPLVAESYARDHRGLDALYEMLNQAVVAPDVLEVARATSAFEFFLAFHLAKEEAHLYKIFNERVSMEDQWVIAAKISQKIPQQRFPDVINWIFPLVGLTDRENLVRIFQRNLPAPMFGGVMQLVKNVIGEGWTELAGRIPEIN